MSGTIKVAMLGGGIGSLAAAWELLHNSEGKKYEITIYQRDWRFGGKCASGRDMDEGRGNRVEEHGIHILAGFYENALHLLHEVYAEVRASPDADKILSWEDALTGSDDLVMADPRGRGWGLWKVWLPANGKKIGGPPKRSSVSDLFSRGSRQYRRYRRQLLRAAGARPWFDWLNDGLSWLINLLLRLLLETRLARLPLARSFAAFLTRWLEGRMSHELRSAWQVAQRNNQIASVRRLWILLWFAGTNLLGLSREGLLLPPRDFLKLDDEDYQAWLERHSVVPMPAASGDRSPPVQALYDLAFSDAYTLAAGTTLWVILHMALDYKGHFVYRMNGGMGDIVFAPLYLALANRPDVEFRFFHEVEDIVPNSAGDAIEEIKIREHFEDLGGHLLPFQIGGRVLHCWPNRPPLVSFPVGDLKTLRAGSEFDVVVLGIAHGALHRLCHRLRCNSRFADMLDEIESVQTQSIQLWIEPTLCDLGWFKGNSMLISYEHPFNSWLDMGHLLPSENWPEGAVKTLAYFADELPRAQTEGQDPDAVVRRNAEQFLTGVLPEIWPHMDYSKLYDPNGGTGAQRLDFQYLRANVDDSDCYVLSVSGSTKYRLAPSESGFSNLALAGDWVKTELNAGSVEAATLGGFGAARAIIDGAVRAAR